MNEFERAQHIEKSMADPLIKAVATAISIAHENRLNETRSNSIHFLNTTERGTQLAKYWVDEAAAALEVVRQFG